ncbi:MAG: hypothetical protein GQ582_01725 [Methyloprofundus sp.]|nr:hypothetical protein [Methyloprofundus sp.]
MNKVISSTKTLLLTMLTVVSINSQAASIEKSHMCIDFKVDFETAPPGRAVLGLVDNGGGIYALTGFSKIIDPTIPPEEHENTLFSGVAVIYDGQIELSLSGTATAEVAFTEEDDGIITSTLHVELDSKTLTGEFQSIQELHPIGTGLGSNSTSIRSSGTATVVACDSPLQ